MAKRGVIFKKKYYKLVNLGITQRKYFKLVNIGIAQRKIHSEPNPNNTEVLLSVLKAVRVTFRYSYRT